MEDPKKPSLEKVIKKLEELDIREWKCNNGHYGKWFTARIGSLQVCVYKWEKHHQLAINKQGEMLYVRYYNKKKDSIEEKKISEFYDKLYKKHEEYEKKELEEALDQVFLD